MSHSPLLPSPRSFLPILCLLVGSCVSDGYYGGPDGNIFLRQPRRPKYGHGGTDSPRIAVDEPNASGRRAPQTEAEGEAGNRRSGRTAYMEETSEGERRSPRDPDEERSSTAESESGGRSSESTESSESSSPPPKTETTESAPPKTGDSDNLPFGVPVPGKEGLVYSPYYNGGYVDVKGMPPGSKARCPYTKKVFRVP